ncbi:MAG: hypothetical protein AB4062_11125, partial [Crocosphaera sp.]
MTPTKMCSLTFRNWYYLPDAVERVYPKARRLVIKEGKRTDGRKVIKRKESDYPLELPNGW